MKNDSAVSKNNLADSTAIQKSIPIPPREISGNELACFYVLNDKEAGTPKPEVLSKWLLPFLDSVNGKIIDDQNLFVNGAGPMGAQLNPNADLLFTAFFPGNLDTSSVVFTMNDFPVLRNKTGIYKREKDGMDICWFLIPKNRFTVMLHLASENEVKSICTMKKMETSAWIKNSCTVMKINVEGKVGKKQVKLENYFLASFLE